MLALAVAALRHSAHRLLGVTAAVVIGVAFLTGTLTFTASARSALTETAAAPLAGADLIVRPAPRLGGAPALDPDWPRTVAELPGVDATHPFRSVFGQLAGPRPVSIQVAAVPDDPALRWFALAEGAWPTGPDEILLDARTARDRELRVGATLTLALDTGEDRTVRVVGIADITAPPTATSMLRVYAAPSFYDADAELFYVLARLAPGADASQVADAIRAGLGDRVSVFTAAQATELAIGEAVGQNDQLTGILTALAAVALIVTVLLISATFSILLTQRRRQDALLRLVGAQQSQVRTRAVVEGLLVGAVGAFAGVLAGGVAGALAARALGYPTTFGDVPPVLLAACWAVGTLASTLAVWGPARRASRVTPMAAVTTAGVPTTRATAQRTPWLRLGLLAVGMAVLAGGAITGDLLLALGGGALSFLGTLLSLRPLTASLLTAVGHLTRSAPAPVQLAVASLRHTPQRTAGTITTLLLASVLISTLTVGSATAQATVDRDLAARYPVDIALTSTDRPLRDADVQTLASSPGVLDAVVLEGVPAIIPHRDGSEFPVVVVGLTPDAAKVTNTALPPLGAASSPPVALLSPGLMRGLALNAGGDLDVTVAGTAHRFTVRADQLANTSATATILIDPAALADLGDAGPVTVWATTDPQADRAEVTAAASTIARDRALVLGGSLHERTQTEATVSTITRIGLGMLAISALLGLLGLSNALNLAVQDRRRAAGVLRALGLPRGGLRAIFAVEATITTGIALVLGFVLGIPYGLIGASTALSQGAQTLVRVPATQLVIIAIVALAAAILASLLPAQRLARTHPSRALTQD